jgi:[glutamine synthetase] adenylyltransferase / [glutamine synthetase]-adenylyl-L-tyrosine phosphorylase
MIMYANRPGGTMINSILPFSRYLQRLLESEPELLPYLEQHSRQPFLRDEMLAFLNRNANNTDDEAGLRYILRSLRKRVMSRLAVRDLGGLADLKEVMTSMTHLAEVTIASALEHHQKWLTDPGRFGQPAGGENNSLVQGLLVVAMGKLGGSELNVSSDVDLIFVYPEDGETDGCRRISNQDLFARLGRKVIGSLNDITSDGYVFRVDMRLRPYGESGPLVMSFAMLEEYFIAQAREWERYAWIKGRVIAGPEAARTALVEQTMQPFVFRKYLDFGAYESMRALHAQIRQEVNRRDMHENIKLGPGGIREVEFIAQVFQLIRGGRDIDLRIQPTLLVLQRLAEKQHLSEAVVAELSAAYCFLRNLEHRLQYLDDQQTQTLPDDPADQALIARSMGFSAYNEFLQRLESHRDNVTRHFEKIFAPRQSKAPDMLTWLWQGEGEGEGIEAEAVSTQLGAMGFANPKNMLDRLSEFRKSTRYRQLPKSSKTRVDILVPLLIEAAARFPSADITLERLLGLLENVSRRASYLALLEEHPQAVERVAKLVSASQWASEYLGRHPILLDELLQPSDVQSAPDWSRSKASLIHQLNDGGASGGGVEQQMDVLRDFHHSRIFQLLAQDLEGMIPLERLSDYLTDLADLVLENVLRLAWAGLRKKHRDEPVFAIVGYGKLGGKELGYVSDLDIIFLYDDPHPDAPEIYARLSQRINSWLTSFTSSGLLYETDLRLRPNGSSGLLVSSAEAFDQYQRNNAWVWEHQALTRARFVTGDPQVGKNFERIRDEVLRHPRELPTLKRDVLAMRQKMLEAHPNLSGLFDVKHDRGGIIDVEFVVQYLVLGHACQHPELTKNIGNIALLKLASSLGLIRRETGQRALDAYRDFRRVQHRSRLSGDANFTGLPTTENKSQKFVRVEVGYFQTGIDAVLQLWNEVFTP